MALPLAELTPLFILRVLSPSIVFFATLSLLFVRTPAPQTSSSPSPITAVVVATRLTYLLDGLAFVVWAVIGKTWPGFTGLEINAVVGLAAFTGLAALGGWKEIRGVDVWSLRRLKHGVFFSLALDIAQVVLLALAITRPLSTVYLVHLAFPAFRVLLLVPLLSALLFPRVSYVPVETTDEETPTDTSLLIPAQDAAAPSSGLSPFSAEASKYGTFRSGRSVGQSSGPTTRTHTPAPSTVRVPPPKAQEAKEDIALDPSWREIFARIKHIAPYLWPSKSASLQFLAFLCFLVMLVGRVVNFLVPLVFAQLVRIFEEGSQTSPWPYLGAYVALRFLQATGGLAALRDTLWIPVMQYSDREMSQLSFDHLLQLSFAFHARRKTGEVLRILDRGAAINHTFETIVFNILPTFFDIAIALVFFVVYFEWTLAIVIFFVMAAYVVASVVLTRWRTKLRRQMNERDMVIRGIHTDCLLNYETVKYFNGEQHEGERYRDSIRQYQNLEYKVMVSLNLLNLVQNFIITLGLLVGSMIVAMRVVRGQSQPHQFVFFITYLAQLYGPLNMLGYLYRTINQSLVDTERLLKLLSEPTEINDRPNAPDLIVENGEIEFDNVNFSYDGRTTALESVSFKVPKGSSVALVGESGAGKSTILRLLYRFYDLKEGDGRILIDGQDLRDVTQDSLRKAIGVVPQDPVLFNASIGYNIAYGKFGATQEEIVAAAKAAQIHDRILSFPDGYDTKVGERGIRLSGGEKQRVAIARTLLKDPPILLLDEATSALDTSTEKDIQKALQNLVQGRSSLSIAHRLSDGRIVEQGTHSELLALGGNFATMWADQVSSTDEAVSAHRKSAVLTGFDVEDVPAQDPVVIAEDLEAVPQVGTEEVAQDALADGEPAVESAPEVVADEATAPVAFPSTDSAEDAVEAAPESSAEPVPEASAAAPVAFPTSANDTAPVSFPSSDAAPLAFPTSDSPVPVAFPGSPDTASQREGSVAERAQNPGVTFQEAHTPSRTGTPDPEADGKRRRTLSTQGIQRLARRISITTRRQGSGSGSSIPAIAGSFIPGLKRAETANSNKDEGSSSKDTPKDSPSASVSSDIGKAKLTKSKKEKKLEKRKTMS
ncbi:Heavy metal tolerance protein [Trametes pubescens]|uniref:Heavy metal tolerance protein n=1 Tax=Trametes pubescens TaxID=154538 RepID=A0A1M2VYZ2_TRAPU|nr:Heavy metal tolerance protein [Trametes pubescens]